MTNASKGTDEPLVYNVWPETGKRLNISRATTYNLVAQGVIPTIRLGRRIVVPKAALERMLDGETHGKAMGE